jgi:hypothetical protein
MFYGPTILNADNLDRLALEGVSVAYGSESPPDASHGPCLIHDQVFYRESRLGVPMGCTDHLLEAVRTVEGHATTTLVVQVGYCDIVTAVVRLACGECRDHPSDDPSRIRFDHCSHFLRCITGITTA